MSTVTAGLEFDPGFAPHVLTFRGAVEYLYLDINKFKNFSQKKMKFRQYYKKMLHIIYNNIGFYTGCLMWAVYLKTQPEQEILSNPFYGKQYNRDANADDTQYMLRFVELFPKDMKYFLSENFEFDINIKKIIDIYGEFLIINKDFTNTKLNTDIKLPGDLKPSKQEEYKTIIDNAVKEGNLNSLVEYIPLLI